MEYPALTKEQIKEFRKFLNDPVAIVTPERAIPVLSRLNYERISEALEKEIGAETADHIAVVDLCNISENMDHEGLSFKIELAFFRLMEYIKADCMDETGKFSIDELQTAGPLISEFEKKLSNHVKKIEETAKLSKIANAKKEIAEKKALVKAALADF